MCELGCSPDIRNCAECIRGSSNGDNGGLAITRAIRRNADNENRTIPILLIRGRLSDVVSEEGVKDFLAKVPSAEFVELSGAGHTAAGDDNDAFTEVVVRFIGK